MTTKTFCPLPWNSVSTRNNGDLRVCCHANSLGPNRGLTGYNAKNADFAEARNAPLLKEVRQSMMKGEWHAECNRCLQEEESGAMSRREYEVKTYEGSEKFLEMTAEDGSIDTDAIDIEYMDVRYGNFCNLKCRMCGPTDSHMWWQDTGMLIEMENERKKADTKNPKPLVDPGYNEADGTYVLLEKNQKGKYEPTNYDYNWYEGSNSFAPQVAAIAKNVKKFYIVGGEPLIIEEHYRMLEELVASGKSKEIEIEYNTNFTNIQQRALELWKEFKLVTFGASIDGYGKVFEYQRSPAKWDAVYKNLKKLDAYKPLRIRAWFTYTISTLNVLHFPDFMKFVISESGLHRFGTPKKMIVNPHFVHSPSFYNIKCLPPMLKEEIIDKYEEAREWAIENLPDEVDWRNKHKISLREAFINELDVVIKFMTNEDKSENWWKFCDWTDKLDKIRDQNIFEIVPEYERYWITQETIEEAKSKL